MFTKEYIKEQLDSINRRKELVGIIAGGAIVAGLIVGIAINVSTMKEVNEILEKLGASES